MFISTRLCCSNCMPVLLILGILFVISLSGCSTSSVYYVSKVTADTYGSLDEELGDRLRVYVKPENWYVVSSTFSPLYIPLVSAKEESFASFYYREHLGAYAKPIEEGLNYFIVELIIDSYGDEISIDFSSLNLIRENNVKVSAEKWHAQDAWVSPALEVVGDELGVGIKCLHIRDFALMRPVTDAVVEIHSEIPTCFILRYPIPPIHPSENFSFEIGNLRIKDSTVSPIKLDFEGELGHESSGYRLGP